MAEDAAKFVGSIPENYDAGLGPHIFVDFGRELAQRAVANRPRRVLELAAGTGIVTRLLHETLPGGCEIVATDLNPPMLDFAKAKFGDGSGLSFEPADAADLPFPDGAFDTIICQFGVMFFPDKEQSYREAHRVLEPGGRYFFNTWDSWAENPFAQIAHETVARFFDGEPPRFYSIPFGYHNDDDIGASLERAGFTDIEIERISLEKEIVSLDLFARGTIHGNPIIEEITNRDGVDPDVVMAAVADAYAAAFGDSPGRMPLRALFVSARRP